MFDTEQFSDRCLHDDLPQFRSMDDFEEAGRAHATTDAHGHNAVLCLPSPPLD
jgi:hypothetical protein